MPRNPNKRRCSGSKTNGEPCPNWAIKGGAVCHAHAGKAPQVKKAARRRQALQTASRMAERAGVELHPMEHLLSSLHRAYQLVLVWSAMVAALDAASEDELAGGLRGRLGYELAPAESSDELRVVASEHLIAFNYRGEAQLHPFVSAQERAIDRHGRLAKLCVDAGIEERQMKLIEGQVRLAQQAFEKALEDGGLDAGQRQEIRKAYARRLRAVA